MAREYLTDDQVVESIQTTYIPRDELVVVGGAALQLFGIKRTYDIDAIVSMPTLINRITGTADGTYGRSYMHSPLGSGHVTREGIAFAVQSWKEFYEAQSVGVLSLLPAPNDKLYSVSFEELRDEAVEKNGILVSPPGRVLEWKEALGRPKDIGDIAKIQAYLAHEVVASK